MNDEIRTIIRLKWAAYNIAQYSHSSESWQTYKERKQIMEKTIKRAKKSYFRNKIIINKDNP